MKVAVTHSISVGQFLEPTPGLTLLCCGCAAGSVNPVRNPLMLRWQIGRRCECMNVGVQFGEQPHHREKFPRSGLNLVEERNAFHSFKDNSLPTAYFQQFVGGR